MLLDECAANFMTFFAGDFDAHGAPIAGDHLKMATHALVFVRHVKILTVSTFPQKTVRRGHVSARTMIVGHSFLVPNVFDVACCTCLKPTFVMFEIQKL